MRLTKAPSPAGYCGAFRHRIAGNKIDDQLYDRWSGAHPVILTLSVVMHRRGRLP
jgi:hypothetical protein